MRELKLNLKSYEARLQLYQFEVKKKKREGDAESEFLLRSRSFSSKVIVVGEATVKLILLCCQ